MQTAPTKTSRAYLRMAFIPLAVGINLGIGALVQVLKLPVFLDSIGTILTALLFGWQSGAIVGVLSFAISSITVFPPAIYFSGTQICIAIYVQIVSGFGGFKNVFRTFVSGIGLAIVAALVSAPVIYYLFGGITGNGISIFTLYLQAHGFSKGASVITSGITAEMIDKVAQCLITLFILKSIPASLLKNFYSDRLKKNNL